MIIAAIAVLVAPNLLETWNRPARVGALVFAMGIFVGTTAALAAPSTAEHVHSGDAGDSRVAGGDDHDHDAAAAADTASRGEHTHDATESAPADDDHHGESATVYDELPRETKAEVDQVSALWANKYPTAADAEQAGWWKSTPSLYGIGAHYIKGVSGLSVAVPFDLLNPNILLYDGEGPDAKFAGVSYVVAGDEEGYTGSYDFWHAHASVCIGSGGITLTEENSPYWYSESECTASGGRVMPLAADKMIHVWIGPGYTDAPTFAHDNPKLLDGYYPKRGT